MQKRSPTTQTEALRAAFGAAQAVAVHIGETTPVIPHGIEARRSLGDVVLQIYFHDSIANVLAFGRHFDACVTTQRHTEEPDSKLYTSAVGDRDGVQFEAWTLTDQADEAHAAEQRHQLDPADAAVRAACLPAVTQ